MLFGSTLLSRRIDRDEVVDVTWRSVLEAADVVLRPVTPREVVVELPSGARTRLRVVQSATTLQPATMRRFPRRADDLPLLWAAPAASPAAVEFARLVGDSLATAGGRVLLQAQGETLELGRPGPRPAAQPRGGRPWGTLAVTRRMLEVDADRQEDLALLAGLSQERVSRILTRLRAQGLITRSAAASPHGRPVERPTDSTALLAWWMNRYPLDEALRAHYVADDPPPAQLQRAAKALVGRRPLLSGDLAADQMAPWRRPGHVLLYCAEPVDLAEAGFLAAPAAEATLTVVTSPDPAVALPARADGQVWAQVPAGDIAVELADPLQVLLDLVGSRAPDTPEAAERLRDELLVGRTKQRVRSWLELIIQDGSQKQGPDRATHAAAAHAAPEGVR